MVVQSIAKNALENRVIELCEKVLSSQGYRPVDVDCKVGPRSLVRIFIEKAGEAKSVSVGDCAVVSRQLEPLLDAEILAGRAYDLEVSSPGLDRRLRLMPDFEAAIGEEVKIQLISPVEGFGVNVRGRIVRVEEDGVILEVLGKTQTKFLLGNTKKANQIWEAK